MKLIFVALSATLATGLVVGPALRSRGNILDSGTGSSVPRTCCARLPMQRGRDTRLPAFTGRSDDLTRDQLLWPAYVADVAWVMASGLWVTAFLACTSSTVLDALPGFRASLRGHVTTLRVIADTAILGR